MLSRIKLEGIETDAGRGLRLSCWILLLALFWLPAHTSAAASDLHEQFQATLDGLLAEHGFPVATVAYVLPDGATGLAATGFSSLRYDARHGVTVAFQINTDIGMLTGDTPVVRVMEQRLLETVLSALKPPSRSCWRPLM